MTKRLELVWPNKDKLLLGLDENGKPIWCTKDDLEPRLLVQLESVGQVNPDKLNDLYEQGDNLLIKGDNLLTLKALERHFAGKIKCIYIDPPFNTGNAFEHYDDGLEHTIWLSMMKARLEILKKLLKKDDGIIAVHIDENELAYLSILLDEIFGRNNFLAFVTVKAKAGAGVGQESFLFGICEYVVIYGRDANFCENFLPKLPQVMDKKTMDTYNKLFLEEGEAELIKTIEGGLVGSIRVFKHNSYKIETIANGNRNNDFYTKNLNIIFRTTNPQGGLMKRIMPQLPKYDLISIEYVPTKGRLAGKLSRFFFYKGALVTWLRDSAFIDENSGELMKLIKSSNIWEENLYQGIAKEGGVEFQQSKKPERLVQRIIEMATSPSDWVLDSFLGSGTTAAVAHKLGRKWIGIELGEHAETLCLPRLKRVVSGEDHTGISKQVEWKGGGGFRYCVLGESLFAKDEDTGLVMINPKYTNGPLVAAVCNLEDFKLNNDSIFHGVRGNNYAHVTEEKVTQAYLDAIVAQLPDGKSLTIYCLKRSTDLKIPPEVKIKRIPKELQIPRYLTNTWKGVIE